MGQVPALIIRQLGLIEYAAAWQAMRDFTSRRDGTTADELWLCQHPPVFTLGLAGKPEHLLRDIGIPVVNSDRGGQVTYHAPGQLICYLLLDLKRRGITVKDLVRRIEQAVIELLAEYAISGERRAGAPGVYVNGAKIAALGLKVKKGCCYHGLSLNVAMDLSPYAAINPCGYAGMAVTQLSAFDARLELAAVSAKLCGHLERQL